MKRAEEKQLIKTLFELWEKLCETGEIHIGPGFGEIYDRLEEQVKEFDKQ